jgi:hypothetical protein
MLLSVLYPIKFVSDRDIVCDHTQLLKEVFRHKLSAELQTDREGLFDFSVCFWYFFLSFFLFFFFFGLLMQKMKVMMKRKKRSRIIQSDFHEPLSTFILLFPLLLFLSLHIFFIKLVSEKDIVCDHT